VGATWPKNWWGRKVGAHPECGQPGEGALVENMVCAMAGQGTSLQAHGEAFGGRDGAGTPPHLAHDIRHNMICHGCASCCGSAWLERMPRSSLAQSPEAHAGRWKARLVGPTLCRCFPIRQQVTSLLEEGLMARAGPFGSRPGATGPCFRELRSF